MTTYFTDDFTGSNGASWSSTNWTTSNITGLVTTGASATIQGNQGRLNSGTVGGYGGHMAERYNGATQADHEWIGKFTITTSMTDAFFETWIRASTSAVDGTGYIMNLGLGSSSNVSLVRANAYSYTTIGTASVTISQNTQYNFKHYCVGTTHKVKVWTGTEPAYQISTTDSTVSAAGYAYVHAHGGNTSGFIIDLDDVTLTNGVGGAAATYTGSCTATGAFRRNLVTKNPFTATVTPAGAYSAIKVVTKTLIASITSTGALVRRPIKTLTGSVAATAVAIKRAPKTFSGSITATGFFRKAFVRIYTGSITAHGTAVATFAGRVFGRPGRVAVSVAKAGVVRLRIRRG